jgi:uncharacterized protein (TIGR04255 family)
VPRHKTRQRSSGHRGETRRQYKNPPIVEATCELRFNLAAEWTLAHTSAFWERIKSRYSGTPKDQQLLEIDASALNNMSEVKPFSRVQFPSINGQESVAVGPGRLSIHVRKPYTGWEIFREQTRQALAWYSETIAIQDIRRIGVRYINLIEPPQAESSVDTYIVTSACKVGTLDLQLKVFNQRFEYQFRDEPVKALVSVAKAEPGPDKEAFLLDIDVIREWNKRGLKLAKVMDAVDDLRGRERRVFESLITTTARRLFDA